MEHRDWVTIEEVARLEGLPYKTIQKRLNRSRALYKNDDADGRRRLYAITVLSPEARNKWLSEQASLAPQTDAAFEIPHAVPTLQSPEQMGSPEALAIAGLTTLAVADSSASVAIAPVAARSLQPILAFAPQSPSQEARDQAVAAIPAKEQRYVDRWMSVLADH